MPTKNGGPMLACNAGGGDFMLSASTIIVKFYNVRLNAPLLSLKNISIV
jgi:hypothetical protein